HACWVPISQAPKACISSIALRERLAFIGYGFKENDVPANGKPSAETALPPESTPAAASGPAPKKK
ncbi:MAG: hypothetical protein AAB304_06700, partial [Pseudomonadota bacterium]